MGNYKNMIYHLLRFLLRLISYIPFRVLYILSDVLGFVLHRIIRYRRKIVRRNLTECFPEKNMDEIRLIEKRFYHFFADSVIETFKMASMSAEEMSRRMKFINIDAVNSRLRKGQSVALYLGHFANWEWISSMPLHLEKGVEAAQIYHKLRNKIVDRLMLSMRGRMGAVNVEMRHTARYITGMVAEHKECIVGFIADQSPRKNEVRNFLQFFHHRTPVLTGTEKIVKHYCFDAWFVRTRRVKRGYYEAEFIHMHDDPRSLPDFELTEIYYCLLEQTIRRHPELYLWSHNRFKHAELSDL